jgi:hypothetical protein
MAESYLNRCIVRVLLVSTRSLAYAYGYEVIVSYSCPLPRRVSSYSSLNPVGLSSLRFPSLAGLACFVTSVGNHTPLSFLSQWFANCAERLLVSDLSCYMVDDNDIPASSLSRETHL